VNSESSSHSTVKETVKISALLFYYNYLSLSKKKKVLKNQDKEGEYKQKKFHSNNGDGSINQHWISSNCGLPSTFEFLSPNHSFFINLVHTTTSKSITPFIFFLFNFNVMLIIKFVKERFSINNKIFLCGCPDEFIYISRLIL